MVVMVTMVMVVMLMMVMVTMLRLEVVAHIIEARDACLPEECLYHHRHCHRHL